MWVSNSTVLSTATAMPTAKAPSMPMAAVPMTDIERVICEAVSNERFLTRFRSATKLAVPALMLIRSSPIVAMERLVFPFFLLRLLWFFCVRHSDTHFQRHRREDGAHLLRRLRLGQPGHHVFGPLHRLALFRAVQIQQRAHDHRRAPVRALALLGIHQLQRGKLGQRELREFAGAQSEINARMGPQLQARAAELPPASGLSPASFSSPSTAMASV